MKKYSSILSLLFLALAFTISGCTSQSSGGGGDKAKLELKLEKGQTFKMVSRMEQDISTKMMGMSNDMDQDMDFYIRQDVQDVNSEGVATLKVTYDRIKYEMTASMLGTTLKYDSEDESTASGPMGEAMGPMIGASFTMQVDKRGKVLDVAGLEELMEKVGGSEATSKSFSPENVKKTMQNMMVMYPDVLIGVGDTWGAETELSGDYPLMMEMTYKVEEISSKSIFLNVDGEIKTHGENEIEGGMGSFEMAGTQGGTMEIDRASGMVKKADFTQDISGEIKTMGMNAPMKIKSKITIEPY